MSQELTIWSTLVGAVLFYCPSILALPSLVVLRFAIGRDPTPKLHRSGIACHLLAILGVAGWLVVADQTSDEGFAIIGQGLVALFVLMPLNWLMAGLGTLLMLLALRRPRAQVPHPLP
ncbi:MAG: hypothetical protein ACRC2H_09335 [Silanimonas sp.]